MDLELDSIIGVGSTVPDPVPVGNKNELPEGATLQHVDSLDLDASLQDILGIDSSPGAASHGYQDQWHVLEEGDSRAQGGAQAVIKSRAVGERRLSGSDRANAQRQIEHARIRALILLCGKGFCCLVSGIIVVGMFFPTPLLHAVPSFLAGSMDLASDPCDDFYQYACGGWERNNPLGTQTTRSQFINAEEAVLAEMSKILEDLKTSQLHTKWTLNLMDAHQLCMEGQRADDIPEAMTNDTMAKRVAEFHNLGIFPYFHFSVGRNPEDGINTLRWHSSTKFKSNSGKVAREREYIENLLTLADERHVTKAADAYMKVKWGLTKEVEPQWNVVTWSKFAKLTPDINWDEYWTAYGVPDYATKFKKVSYDSQEALEKINELFGEGSERQLSRYERGVQLSAVAATTDELYELHDKYVAQESGVPVPPQWKQCVWYAAENFGWVLSQKFLEKHPAAKKESRQVLHAVLHAFSPPSWMDAATKAIASAKRDAMVVNVVAPDWMDKDEEYKAKLEKYYAGFHLGDDMSTNAVARARASKEYMLSIVGKPQERDWDVESVQPTDVKAYYCPYENSLNFPAGILRDPFIDSSDINALNWGSLGTLVGQRLFRAFDKQGADFDKDGQHSPWWDPDTTAKFEEKETCMTDQYDALGASGARKLRETFADNAGFALSYKSFLQHKQDWTGVHDGRHYSEKKIFYLAFAQTMCSQHANHANSTSDPDEHLAGSVRVNGVIQNAADFGDLFKCPVGSRMNPRKKCIVT